MNVGRMFYHVGSPLGPAYKSHPWKKGWPTVAPEAVLCTSSCSLVYVCIDFVFSYDAKAVSAMLGHACTMFGLSRGECRSGERSPPQVRLRSMTWKRTGGVYPRCPTFTRDHLCMCLWTPAGRTRTSPCSPRSPPARTQPLTRAHLVCSRHSRDARTSACLLPDAPGPRPRAPSVSHGSRGRAGMGTVLR